MIAENCQILLEKLIEFSFKKEFLNEMQTARKLYEISTGKVNDEDYFYEQRMNLFQDYFLFDFRLKNFLPGGTLFEYFIQINQAKLSVQDLLDFEEFRNQRFSLFSIKENHKNHIIVYDYFTKQRYKVFALPRYSFIGFQIEHIFQARLINYKDQFFFTGSFVFHHGKVKSLIEYQIQKFFKNKRNLTKDVTVTRWNEELRKREHLIEILKNEEELSSKKENKRPIDVLNLSKKIAEIPREMRTKKLVMSLGEKETMPVFVTEPALYDLFEFMEDLLYCEIQTHRYKHLDANKIYMLSLKSSEGSIFKKEPQVQK
jgi:hypothetical protein